MKKELDSMKKRFFEEVGLYEKRIGFCKENELDSVKKKRIMRRKRLDSVEEIGFCEEMVGFCEKGLDFVKKSAAYPLLKHEKSTD